MKPAIRSLLMRANRLLGAQLVEYNLIKIDDLEAANESLLEIINTGPMRQRSVFAILVYDLRAVREEDVLLHQRESDGIGIVDLRHYEVNEELKNTLDTETCWATWSVPFDVEEDMTFIATAYYLSPAVRKYWEDQYSGKVIWYGTTMEGLATYLEGIEDKAEAEKPAALKPISSSPPEEVTPAVAPENKD